MKTRLLLSLLIAAATTAAAQSDIIPLTKKRSDNTLTAGFDTGAKTVKISATGTLEWVNGATLTGASYFRTAAGAEAALTFSTGLTRTTNTITLATTGIAAGSYGSGTQVACYTVDVYGRITAVVAQNITPPESLVTFTDITTHNASTSMHGYLPKLDGNSAHFLDGTGAWTSPPSGITIGSTVITGGTSGRLLTSGGAVGELTLGTGVSAALGNAVDAASGLLTYGIIGTSGAKVPLLNASNTFGAAQAFTSTLSADPGAGYPQFTATGYSGNGLRVTGDRIDFWFGGVPQFTVASGSFDLGATACAWGGSARLYGGSDATGRLVQRVGTSPQAFSVANTYTSYTNKEEVELGWTSNVAHLWTIKGSGGGSARDLVIGTDEQEQVRLKTNGDVIIQYDELPTADPAVKGQLWRSGNALMVSPGP